jgi:geranylgeranyl diphosphate synthase, type I
MLSVDKTSKTEYIERPPHPDLDIVRTVGERVENRLSRLLSEECRRCTDFAPASSEALEALHVAALSGGKRVRPGLAYIAFVGAGGAANDPRAVDLGAAIELLHAGLLVHDDIMDAAMVRRSLPTVHVRFEGLHRASAYWGDAKRFGESVAIIVGDLAFFYAMGLLAETGSEVQTQFVRIAADVGVGQYLDLVGSSGSEKRGEDPALIAQYKTARYTVEGPLHLGAALAGRLDELGAVFSSYGEPLGKAYQMRDDLLGAFGDPAVTGKPVGDDLRQGKRTILLETVKERRAVLMTSGRVLLDKMTHGQLSDEDVRWAQQMLIDVGAADHLRDLCSSLAAESIAAIATAPISDIARDSLKTFAVQLAESVQSLSQNLRSI